NGRLAVQTGAFVEPAVFPDQTLSVSGRVVRIRRDDFELRLSRKRVVSCLLLLDNTGALRSGALHQRVDGEDARNRKHKQRGEPHQSLLSFIVSPRAFSTGYARARAANCSAASGVGCRRLLLQSKAPRQLFGVHYTTARVKTTSAGQLVALEVVVYSSSVCQSGDQPQPQSKGKKLLEETANDQCQIRSNWSRFNPELFCALGSFLCGRRD